MANFPSIEEKFAGTGKEIYLQGPCADLLRTIYECYHSSKMLIKGLDCVEKFKEYHACCRTATEEEIQRMNDEISRKNSRFYSFLFKKKDEIEPYNSTVNICPPDIVAFESVEPEDDE